MTDLTPPQPLSPVA